MPVPNFSQFGFLGANLPKTLSDGALGQIQSENNLF